MSEESYDGIPREKIPWDPKINYETCTSCGKCVDFCHTNSFLTEETQGKKRVVVVPKRCVVFCRGCEDVCPVKAISHPSEEETLQIIEKLKQEKP
jgi:NAD-dependent dihydropyrimidine dehydrogenase PreA subunit